MHKLFNFLNLHGLAVIVNLPGLFGLPNGAKPSGWPRFDVQLPCCLSALYKLLCKTHIALILLLLLSSACAQTSPEIWANMAENASTHNFQAKTFNVKPFLLSGLLKNTPGKNTDLVVYIEGDGAALTSARKIAYDPSPSQAQGYELAILDPAPRVLYLARIGQFQPNQTGPLYQKYWAEERFSLDAIEAANEAINQAKVQTASTSIHLIGFSGGGGIATILAERRDDVKSLVTVAGLLDINWWVTTFAYKPLNGSLNPADRAAMISTLPQIHFNGKADKVIPPEMATQFKQKTDFLDFRIITLPNDHYTGWTKIWPKILRQYVLPMRAKAMRG